MESWLTLFVAVTAIAFVIQLLINLALFMQVRKLVANVDRTLDDLRVQIGPTLTRIQVLVDDVSPRITGIVMDASELTRLARSQAQKVDRVFSETIERLRMQLIHVDQILTGAMETVEDAGAQLRQTVLGPIAKATALIRGIQTGVEFFRTARRNGPPPDSRSETTQQDEGMFI
jgi:hypothetical protein